jgi:hypothetical protein
VLDEVGREVADGVAAYTVGQQGELLQVAGVGDVLLPKVAQQVLERVA